MSATEREGLGADGSSIAPFANETVVEVFDNVIASVGTLPSLATDSSVAGPVLVVLTISAASGFEWEVAWEAE